MGKKKIMLGHSKRCSAVAEHQNKSWHSESGACRLHSRKHLPPTGGKLKERRKNPWSQQSKLRFLSPC